MSSLYFTICAFFVSLLIIIVFFSRERVKNRETELFTYLISINMYVTIIELVILYLTYCGVSHSIISLLNRLYLPGFLLWAWIFLLYIFYIVFNNKKIYKYYDISLKVTAIINTIVLALIFILPINIFYDGNTMYSYGYAVTLLYIVCAVYLVLVIVFSLFNIKSLKKEKCLPIFSLIILAIIIFVVRSINPGLLLITAMLTYINLTMFFTIENPDVKLVRQMELSKKQAKKANQAKSDFLSNMSHEIRTPLNAIVGFSQSLQTANTLKQAKEDGKDILVASEVLLDIVNGVLDISKIEANKLEIVNKEYNPDKIIGEVITLTQTRLREKPIKFVYKIDENMPKTLYGDYKRIKQCLLNILTNAVKYTKEGQITFTVDSIVKKDVCRLIMTVEDTGIGIKPEQINKLFKKFERLNDDYITAEGTGLGLAITKSLLDMMGGKVVCQSVYGKGSKFTIALDQRIINKTVVSEIKQNNISKLDLRGKKILVVDDNKLNLKVAARLLSGENADIDDALSGIICIDKIKAGNKYDIILMDIMMPELDGIKTLQRLKEIPNFNTPVVALTADAIEGTREKYLDEGFDDYIAKPIDMNELRKVLKKFLNKK